MIIELHFLEMCSNNEPIYGNHALIDIPRYRPFLGTFVILLDKESQIDDNGINGRLLRRIRDE